MIKIFQKGFSMTLAFFGIIAIILFIVAFKNLREVNVEKLKTIPIKDSVKAIKGNWPWILIVTANLIFWIAIMFLLSLLKALMTLASWFFIVCLGILGLFLLIGIVREAWNWMRMLPHWRDNGRRMLVKGVGLVLFAASLTLIVMSERIKPSVTVIFCPRIP